MVVSYLSWSNQYDKQQCNVGYVASGDAVKMSWINTNLLLDHADSIRLLELICFDSSQGRLSGRLIPA